MKNSKNSRRSVAHALLMILTLALLMNGCFSSKRILKKYYILEPSLAPVLADSIQYQTLPYTVVVNPFTVRYAYKTTQIALRSKSNELQYYVYHVWGEPLGEAMRFFVWRRLKALKLFRRASMTFMNEIPQYLIDGTITLLEWRNPTGHSKKPIAHIQMILEFKDFKTNQVLVEYAFDRSAPLPKKSSMNDFVAAINRILNSEVDVFIAKINAKMK